MYCVCLTLQELCARPGGVTGPNAPMKIASAMARHGVLLPPGMQMMNLTP
jgi:hypothetical protein